MAPLPDQGRRPGQWQRGGNAFRTWRVDPDPQRQRALLDRAQRDGLKVAVGIEVGNPRYGFDYNDATAVRQQRQRILAQVRQSATHPAVLMWVVGNELNLDNTNPKVWDAVGEIADAIHAIDPDHPVTTALAGIDKQLIDQLNMRAPALDLIAVQLYGAISALPQKVRDSQWRGRYVITDGVPPDIGNLQPPVGAHRSKTTARARRCCWNSATAAVSPATRARDWGRLFFCGATNRSVPLPGTACSCPRAKPRPAWTRCSCYGPGGGRPRVRQRCPRSRSMTNARVWTAPSWRPCMNA